MAAGQAVAARGGDIRPRKAPALRGSPGEARTSGGCDLKSRLPGILGLQAGEDVKAEMMRDATYDPCAGCNMDRAVCNGRPKSEPKRGRW